MKKFFVIAVLMLANQFLSAQKIDAVISVAEVERIEKVLAADDMRGRKTFSPEIDKAADFIAAEFN